MLGVISKGKEVSVKVTVIARRYKAYILGGENEDEGMESR